MLKIYLSPELKQIDDKDFLNELQYQVNSFLSSKEDYDVLYYIPQYKPIVIAIYFPEPNIVYVEQLPKKDDRY